MIRRLFTAASVVSLVLAVASIYPWSRSHVSGCRAEFGWKNSSLFAVESLEGRLEIAEFWGCPKDVPFHWEGVTNHVSIASMSGSWQEGWYKHYAWLVESENRGAAGQLELGATRGWPVGFLPYRCVVLRYRGIFSLLLILPSLWCVTEFVRSVVASAREHYGACPKCCYDLTGNTSGVCPECGTAIVRKAGV